MSPRRRWWCPGQIALLLLLLAPLAGCSLNQPLPERRTLVLPTADPVGHGPGCGVLRLHRIRTDSPFERKSVLYRVDGSDYQRDPYTSFYAPPGLVVRQLTGDWLRGARIFDMVIDPGDAQLEDWILVGVVERVFVDRVSGLYDEVVFDVEYTLLERLMMKPLFQRRYGAVVAIPEQGLDAAWGEAFSRVLRNFERDLRVVIRGTEVCQQFTPEPVPAPAAAPPAGSDTSPGAVEEGVPARVEDSG